MKKALFIFLFSLLVTFPVFAGSKLKTSLSIDGRFLDNKIVPAASLSFDFERKDSMFLSGYLRGEYIDEPLGSPNCGIATFESFLESGISLNKYINTANNTFLLEFNLGYYAQLLHLCYYKDYTIAYNGVMARAKFSILAFELFKTNVLLGGFYQLSIISKYSRFDGFGVFVTL